VATENSQTWLRRKWPWLALAGILVIGVGVGTYVILHTRSLKSSRAYEETMRIAQKHPTLIAEMGAPIEAGWFVRGEAYTKEGIDRVRLTIPIHGPKKAGTLRAFVWKSNLILSGVQQWDVVFLEADVDGRPNPIDLTGASHPPELDR
jgi:hypothetical protein